MTVICKTCGAPREGSSVCRPCANRRNAEYKLRHAEKIAADRAAYKKRKHAEGAEDRKQKKAAKAATVNARKAEARAKWKAANPHRVVADCAYRHAAKMRAIPKWADRQAIAAVYATARRLTDMFAGTKVAAVFHVDHIVPLRSPFVCGLHVENNLRAIPSYVNEAKNNRDWPDSAMPATQCSIPDMQVSWVS